MAGLCGWVFGETTAPKVDLNAEKVVAGNNAFGFELYGKLKGLGGNRGNVFMSPYSISTALGMTYAGARGNTEAQMAKVMHFEVGQGALHPAFGAIISDLKGRDKKAYELTTANALWAQKGYPFRKEYFELVMGNYGAGLENVDFAGATEEARRTINAWVEKETKDKIKELFKPGVLDDGTRLVLTNAIYFKGKWEEAFDKKRTKDEVFHVDAIMLRGQPIVPFMHMNARFKYWEGDGFQMLELPYKGDELAMVIFLPRAVDGLAKLEEKLTAENVMKWMGQMQSQEVEVALPRFKMESEFSLGGTLSAMGMTDAFSLERADFSGMTEKGQLYISAVVHKAYVEVNEEGTEAAAATGVAIAPTAVPEPRTPVVFKADHPFFFMIRDKGTGSILFMGRVVDPSGAEGRK